MSIQTRVNSHRWDIVGQWVVGIPASSLTRVTIDEHYSTNRAAKMLDDVMAMLIILLPPLIA